MNAPIDGPPEAKVTPLLEHHKALGGKIVAFAGWQLPVQYSGVIPEHRAVRSAAGIFDVSHMGELWVRGSSAERALERLTCNSVASLPIGKAQYNALINERGGVVDDIIIYRFAKEIFFLCVNAANTARDREWITSHNPLKAEVVDVSSQFGQIAVQGPRAVAIASDALELELESIAPFAFREEEFDGIPLIIARTGYTGEDGVEIFTPWSKTGEIWEQLLGVGASQGLVPAGLGARDSLRLEACYPLHGHELSEEISALESGLGWIVKLDKGEFIGRAALEEQKRRGAPRSLVGFVVDDAGIARAGDVVCSVDGKQIGVVTSGTRTPTVDRSLGLALVATTHSAVDTPLTVTVRGKPLAAHIAKTPFYKKTTRHKVITERR